MTYLFLDTETFGLDLDHDVWEIAYAFDDQKVQSSFVEHDASNAEPEALDINGYRERFTGVNKTDAGLFESRLISLATLEKPTLVGANPSFDAERLLKRWGLSHSQAPWHYRMIDVSVYAMPLLGLDKPAGLYQVAQILRDGFGMKIAESDHTAANDVECVRDVFNALRWQYERANYMAGRA